MHICGAVGGVESNFPQISPCAVGFLCPDNDLSYGRGPGVRSALGGGLLFRVAWLDTGLAPMPPRPNLICMSVPPHKGLPGDLAGIEWPVDAGTRFVLLPGLK